MPPKPTPRVNILNLAPDVNIVGDADMDSLLLDRSLLEWMACAEASISGIMRQTYVQWYCVRFQPTYEVLGSSKESWRMAILDAIHRPK